MIQTRNKSEGRDARFDFDGTMPLGIFHAEWPIDRIVTIARLEVVKTERTEGKPTEPFRVEIPVGDDFRRVQFNCNEDDSFTFKGASFERAVSAQVTGPKGQRVRFALIGKFEETDK